MIDVVCESVNIKTDQLVNFDLQLSDCNKPTYCGLNNEFVNSGKLDNQTSCFSLLQSLIDFQQNEKDNGITMGLFFDNEEIGSETCQGAHSYIQLSTINRILDILNKDKDIELYQKIIRKSFVLSVDGAQGVHPNYSE